MDQRSLTPRRSSAPSRESFDPFLPGFFGRHDLDRIFQDFFRGLPGFGGSDGVVVANLVPRLDIRDTEQGLDISVELPGVAEGDAEIEINDNILTVRGEKRMEQTEEGSDKDQVVVERAYGTFMRQVQLPFSPNPESVTANFADGVLHIRIPRPPEMAQRRRRIQIGSSQGKAEGREGRQSKGQSAGKESWESEGGAQAGGTHRS